jgi:hypothetical protein
MERDDPEVTSVAHEERVDEKHGEDKDGEYPHGLTLAMIMAAVLASLFLVALVSAWRWWLSRL